MVATFWRQFAFSIKANQRGKGKVERRVKKKVVVDSTMPPPFKKKKKDGKRVWFSLVGLIPTGGWMTRTGGINRVSHHLVAQPEKLFSLVLLLLQATAELLIYLQPLEDGTPGFV